MTTKLTIAALLAVAALQANPITVTLTGVNGVTNSQGDAVLPYTATVGGQTGVDVICYDFFNQVQIGQSWTANVDNLQQAAATGQFSGLPNAKLVYEDLAALALESYSGALAQTELQETIWDVTDPGAFPMDADMEADLALAQAEVAAGTVDYAEVEFLEVAPGQVGQDFMVITPEPVTSVLLGLGLVFIGGRQKKA